jgi:hypothetical protein
MKRQSHSIIGSTFKKITKCTMLSKYQTMDSWVIRNKVELTDLREEIFDAD